MSYILAGGCSYTDPNYECINYTKEEMQQNGAHKSEWDWMGWDFDFVIENNGTKEELYQKVDDLIVSNKISNTPTELTDTPKPLAIGANSF